MSYVSWFLCMLCNFLLRTGQFEYCGNAGNQILPLLRDWFCFLLRSSVVSLYSDFSKLFLQILSCVCYWRIILALSLWHLRGFFKCVGFFSVLFVLSVYAYLNVLIDSTRESPVAWGSWIKSNIPAGPQGTPILTKWPNPQILEYKVLIVHLVPASHFREASSCPHIAAGWRSWGMVDGSRKQLSYQSSAASPVTKHFSGCCKCQSEC